MISDETLSNKATLRKIKYLNNIIEQDHRFIKRKVKPMLGFHSFKTAEKTICGIELFHMIRKGQVEEIQSVLSKVEFINNILGIAAQYSSENAMTFDFVRSLHHNQSHQIRRPYMKKDA